ncbi:MAG: 50S ribosomal protein L25/general stress protein Ctc [Pelagibacteraceae bacterium]|jgi:large subunit ribosomal protein L25|nr:50S ribosomal protein L25/general stress protein Ctc [Pseudomonadota bacterium]NCW79541.1 50S ribosomal protein L25/general stress protein Ctc [Pelagibacteraceae bacterium]
MDKNLDTLQVELRQTKSRGELNKLRLNGFVPGVLYGDIETNINLSIKKNSLEKLLKFGNFMSKVIDIKVDGKDFKVLPRDIEFDKVTNQPIHIDFQKLSAGTKVVVWIPVRFINENICPGLKIGGVLNIVRRKVELRCPADQIPSELTVDLSKSEIGESIRISNVTLPENVKPTIDRDFMIATVAAPTVVKEPEPGEAAATADAATAEGTEPAAADKDAKPQDEKAKAAEDKKK